MYVCNMHVHMSEIRACWALLFLGALVSPWFRPDEVGIDKKVRKQEKKKKKERKQELDQESDQEKK